MGSESSNSESESSNSGKRDNKLEKLEMREENANTIIKRVWIAKRSINIKDDDHVQAFSLYYLDYFCDLFIKYNKKLSLDKPK